MSVLQIRTVIAIVAILLVSNLYHCNKVKEPDNSRILVLEAEKKVLEAAKDSAVLKYTVAAKQRDMARTALKNKLETDKIAIQDKHEVIRYKIILLTDSASVELLAQNTSVEYGLPATTEYQGESVAVITMNQVDSINLTYQYVEECEEYQDSLQSNIAGLHAVIDSGLVAEDHLKYALNKSEGINDINDLIVESLNLDNKKLKRKLRLNKFVARITSVAAIILVAIILVPGV